MDFVARALEAYAAGDLEQAAASAVQAKSEAPRSARIRELLGLTAYHLGRWQEAARELLTYKRLSGSLDHNHVIADCYRALERPDRALEIVAEVSQAKVSPEIWAELMIVAAGALADKGDVAAALERVKRADVEPRTVEAYHLRLWYVMGDLLERAGKKAEAKHQWSRIAAEDPDFFDVGERLGG